MLLTRHLSCPLGSRELNERVVPSSSPIISPIHLDLESLKSGIRSTYSHVPHQAQWSPLLPQAPNNKVEKAVAKGEHVVLEMEWGKETEGKNILISPLTCGKVSDSHWLALSSQIDSSLTRCMDPSQCSDKFNGIIRFFATLPAFFSDLHPSAVLSYFLWLEWDDSRKPMDQGSACVYVCLCARFKWAREQAGNGGNSLPLLKEALNKWSELCAPAYSCVN